MHHIIPPTPCIVDRSKHVLIYGMHSLGVDKNNVLIPRSVSSPIKLSQVLSGSFFSLLDENRKLVFGKVIYTVHYCI